jgi:hypothetical protein
MTKLAINGGNPIRTEKFPIYHAMGEEEKQAVMEVMDGKVLSAFLGTWSEPPRAYTPRWAQWVSARAMK